MTFPHSSPLLTRSQRGGLSLLPDSWNGQPVVKTLPAPVPRFATSTAARTRTTPSRPSDSQRAIHVFVKHGFNCLVTRASIENQPPLDCVSRRLTVSPTIPSHGASDPRAAGVLLLRQLRYTTASTIAPSYNYSASSVSPDDRFWRQRERVRRDLAQTRLAPLFVGERDECRCVDISSMGLCRGYGYAAGESGGEMLPYPHLESFNNDGSTFNSRSR
ncbi:hypothetical protein NEOLEDRAFT_1137862 [Neolentinus lepideus HHB14362 ss-1]|uniref:Uncharacterized protein n=1 Tax=Neolentinus lepideus HHB14362 ss-1 TaxID=1314782 RepID=A0A165QM40_9AGAM|nr:hypothetical protein NEOLEDRAFT_1137862 [Neolentinus lepideus HHB14362 ss-1]